MPQQPQTTGAYGSWEPTEASLLSGPPSSMDRWEVGASTHPQPRSSPPRPDAAIWWLARTAGPSPLATTPFPGSLSQLSLNAPVVDAVASSAGEGAWLLGQDGGIFALKSPFYGNAVDEANPPPVFPGTVIGNGGYVGKVPCPGGGSVTVAAQIAQNTSNLLAAARQGGIILCGWGWRSTETQIQLRKKKTAVVIPTYNIWQKPASQCEPDLPSRADRNARVGLRSTSSMPRAASRSPPGSSTGSSSTPAPMA